MIMSTDFDTFTTAYVDCALWSSVAYGSPDEAAVDPDHTGSFDGSFEYCNYDADDLAPSCRAEIIRVCAEFQENYRELLAQAGSDAQNGHDFWLTRNGHGAGFWDRGYPESVGDKLADAAHGYGACDLYVGDDGAIYGD
jgi:hypothetical protein